MSNLNSYVDLLNNGSNADCFCIYSYYDIEDETAAAEDIKNYKAGKAGDEEAAEAYVRNHSVIITDLQGNVQFDLLNQLAYRLPDLKVEETKENNINKTVINNYFINYYKFINGQMSKERFEKRISRMIKG